MLMLVLTCAIAGGLIGALLPEWLARLPEPRPNSDAPEPDERGDEQFDEPWDERGSEGQAGACVLDEESRDQEQEAAGFGDARKVPYAALASARLLRPTLALVTAVGYALVSWRLGASPALPAALYLTAVGILLCYVDLRVRLLPNAVVLPSYAVVAGLLTVAALLSGSWAALLWALGCGAGMWLLFAIAGFVYPAGVGFGDVKLIGLLSFCLGWFGAPSVVVGLAAAFTIGGLVSLGLILARRARLESYVPFGPFLVGGFLIALLFAEDLVRWYLFR